MRGRPVALLRPGKFLSSAPPLCDLFLDGTYEKACEDLSPPAPCYRTVLLLDGDEFRTIRASLQPSASASCGAGSDAILRVALQAAMHSPRMGEAAHSSRSLQPHFVLVASSTAPPQIQIGDSMSMRGEARRFPSKRASDTSDVNLVSPNAANAEFHSSKLRSEGKISSSDSKAWPSVKPLHPPDKILSMNTGGSAKKSAQRKSTRGMCSSTSSAKAYPATPYPSERTAPTPSVGELRQMIKDIRASERAEQERQLMIEQQREAGVLSQAVEGLVARKHATEARAATSTQKEVHRAEVSPCRSSLRVDAVSDRSSKTPLGRSTASAVTSPGSPSSDSKSSSPGENGLSSPSASCNDVELW